MDVEADSQAENYPLPFPSGENRLTPGPTAEEQRQKLVRLLGRILARHWLRERRKLQQGSSSLDNNRGFDDGWQPAPPSQPDG